MFDSITLFVGIICRLGVVTIVIEICVTTKDIDVVKKRLVINQLMDQLIVR